MDNLNSMDIKRANRNRVFQYLRKGGVFSKRDIAYALGMSLPTVTRNLSELQALSLVNEIGSMKSTGGRKAIGVEINANAWYAIGLDVTRNHVAVLILNLSDDILFRERYHLTFQNKPAYFKRVGELVDQAVQTMRLESDKVLGVGISVPAIISRDRLILCYSTVLGTSGISRQNFAEYLRYPCRLCNDAKAAGSAERHVSDRPKNMIYLSLSNSVGGAIISGDSIFTGDSECSAEFGHIKIVPNGETCYCGQSGCVDAYCNAMVLSKYENGNLERFFEKLQAGEEKYEAVWQEYLDHLACTIDSLRMVFDWPLVLGGYVGSYIEPYIPEIFEKVKKISTFGIKNDDLLACKRKLEASAVGAAYSYLDPFLQQI